MKDLNNYILEKFKISKDTKDYGNLIVEFCRLTSLNIAHPDNEELFNDLISCFEKNGIDKNSDISAYGDEDDVSNYWSMGYQKDIKDSFNTDEKEYKSLYDYVKKAEKGNLLFDYDKDNTQVKCMKGLYGNGTLLTYFVPDDLSNPFIFIIKKGK